MKNSQHFEESLLLHLALVHFLKNKPMAVSVCSTEVQIEDKFQILCQSEVYPLLVVNKYYFMSFTLKTR